MNMKQYKINELNKTKLPELVEWANLFLVNLKLPMVVREFSETDTNSVPYKFFIPVIADNNSVKYYNGMADWFDYEELDSSEYHPLKTDNNKFYYPEPYSC